MVNYDWLAHASEYLNAINGWLRPMLAGLNVISFGFSVVRSGDKLPINSVTVVFGTYNDSLLFEDRLIREVTELSTKHSGWRPQVKRDPRNLSVTIANMASIQEGTEADE